MPNPYVIIGIIVFYVGSLFGVGIYERSVRDDYWQAKFTKDKLAAVTEAITIEREHQGKVNDIAKQQNKNLQSVNDNLAAQLKWLRVRSTSGNPKESGFIGQSATGSILSERDAEFLAEFSARAETVRTGLASCYNYADVIQK